VDIIETAIKKAGDALGEELSLTNLDWPHGITNAFTYVQSAGAAFIGFLLVGLASLILATLSAFWSLFRASRTTAKFLFITSVVNTPVLRTMQQGRVLTVIQISLLTLTICSGIATAIVTVSFRNRPNNQETDTDTDRGKRNQCEWR
jgi:hypothetical protein